MSRWGVVKEAMNLEELEESWAATIPALSLSLVTFESFVGMLCSPTCQLVERLKLNPQGNNYHFK